MSTMRVLVFLLLALFLHSSNTLALHAPDIHEEFFSNFISPEEEYVVVLHELPPENTGTAAKIVQTINKIEAEQTSIKKQMLIKNIGVKKSTQKASNSLLVNANPSKLEEMKDEGLIKNYYKNLKTQTFLDEVIPYLNVSEVWEGNPTPYTGKGVKVAVIDSGVDYTHASLGGCLGTGCKVIGGVDFYNYDNDPMDDDGHGTHVASIIAGNDPNGFKGIAPDAEIIAVKTQGSDGSGDLYSLLEAFEYVIDLNNNSIPFENDDDYVDIVSMSLGAPYNNPDHIISLAANELVRKGILVVVAAGNDGPQNYTIAVPGAAKDVLTVGASGNDYGRTANLEIDGIQVPANASTHSGLGSITGTIYDAGDGTDFSSVPAGGIAIARRGNISFNEMVINAKEYGVEGLIILNNQPAQFIPLVFMNSSIKIVAVSSEYNDTLLFGNSATIEISRSSHWANSLAPFSSRGPTTGVNYTIIKPDVVSPGFYICAASFKTPSVFDKCLEGDYVAWPGTSMATPVASGIAALYKEAHPELDSYHLRDALRSSTSNINTDRIGQGAGLLNPTLLFNENRSIILNGSLYFKPAENKTGNNFTIYNPTSEIVNYTISSDYDSVLTYPSLVSVEAKSYKRVDIESSIPPNNILDDIRINDSHGNDYVVLLSDDARVLVEINLQIPERDENYELRQKYSFLYMYDTEAKRFTEVINIRPDDFGRKTIYYLYDPDGPQIDLYFQHYSFFYNWSETDTINVTGIQHHYLERQTVESRNINLDFSDCENHEFVVFDEGLFNSFFAFSGEAVDFPMPGQLSTKKKSFSSVDIDDFKYYTAQSEAVNICEKNIPDSFKLDMYAYKQDHNNFYLVKKRFDTIPEYYENPEYYDINYLGFDVLDTDKIIYPYSTIRYSNSDLYGMTYPEMSDPVDTTKAIIMHTDMDEESFYGRGSELYFFTEQPSYVIKNIQGTDVVQIHWEKDFITLPSYRNIDNSYTFKTDMCVISDEQFGVLDTLMNEHDITFVPDDTRLYTEPHFISNIFNISPGNLNYYTNVLSASNHPSIMKGFPTGSVIGAYVFLFTQDDKITPLVSCYNNYFGFGYYNILRLDTFLPLTVNVSLPVYGFVPENHNIDSHSMSINYTWHTTMSPIDANPPSIIDVDVIDSDVRIAIADENLLSVTFSINGKQVSESLIGSPYNQQPISSYETDPQDYFVISLLDPDTWYLLTIHAEDRSGNWFTQSFYVKANIREDVLGDLNDDGFVNIMDLVILSNSYGLNHYDQEYIEEYDVYSDSTINILDFIKIINNFD